MSEIEDVGALLEANETGPQLDSPERSDIDVTYEKSNNKSESSGNAVYEVEEYEGVEEEFYEELELGFETSVDRIALDRENEKAIFENTDGSYDALEVVDTYRGDLILKGRIYGQDHTWALNYSSEDKSLNGKNLSTGAESELEDPNLVNKIELLKRSIVHSEKVMENYLRSDEYSFVKTEKMKEDFERIPEAEGKIWDGRKPVGKLGDVRENLSLADVKPKEAFTKEYGSSLKPGLQLAHDDYRFVFYDGSHIEGLDDQTFFGIRAFSKHESGQKEFSNEIGRSNESFQEYVERILREEGILT